MFQPAKKRVRRSLCYLDEENNRRQFRKYVKVKVKSGEEGGGEGDQYDLASMPDVDQDDNVKEEEEKVRPYWFAFQIRVVKLDFILHR